MVIYFTLTAGQQSQTKPSQTPQTLTGSGAKS